MGDLLAAASATEPGGGLRVVSEALQRERKARRGLDFVSGSVYLVGEARTLLLDRKSKTE